VLFWLDLMQAETKETHAQSRPAAFGVAAIHAVRESGGISDTGVEGYERDGRVRESKTE